MDNAFFTREQRQFARRRPVAWRYVGGTLFVMAALIVALIVWVPSGTLGKLSLAAWSLVTVHLFLCWMAAGYGLSRTMSAEAQIGTLEGVLLLPYAPTRWWLLKMGFAAALVVVAWCIPLPLYLMAALVGLLDASSMISAPLTALFLGLIALPLGLLGIPEYLPRSDRATLRASVAAQTALRVGVPVKANTAGNTVSAQGGEGVTLAVFYGMWLISVIMRGRDCLWQPMSFFGLILPEWCLALPITLLVAWAIAEQGRALVLGRDRYELRAAWVRGGAALALIVWGWGAIWVRLPLNMRLLSLLSIGGAALVLTLYSLRRQREARALKVAQAKAAQDSTLTVDGGMSELASSLPAEAAYEEGATPLLTGKALIKREREEARIAKDLSWLLSKSDNALWQKDVRAHLRLSSLRTMNKLSAFLTVFTLVVLYGAWQWMPRGSGGGIYQIIWLLIGSLSRPAALGFARWNREARGCTLLLLLTSPLSSREILKGRLAASFVVGWLGAIPSLLGLLVLVIGGSCLLSLNPLPQLAYLGPALFLSVTAWLPLLVAIQIGSITNAQRVIPTLKKPCTLLDNLCTSAGCVLGITPLALAPAIVTDKVSLPVGASLSLAVCALSCALCFALFQLRMRQLDTLRQGDLPFDALRSHALAEPQRKSARKGASQPQVSA